MDWEYATSDTPSYSTTMTDDLNPALFTTITTTTTTTTRHGEPEDFPDFRPIHLPDYVTAVGLDPRSVGNPFFLTAPSGGPDSLYDLPPGFVRETGHGNNNPDWDPMLPYDPENTCVQYTNLTPPPPPPHVPFPPRVCAMHTHAHTHNMERDALPMLMFLNLVG